VKEARYGSLALPVAYAAAVTQASVEELSATFRSLAARPPATQHAEVSPTTIGTSNPAKTMA